MSAEYQIEYNIGTQWLIVDWCRTLAAAAKRVRRERETDAKIGNKYRYRVKKISEDVVREKEWPK